MVEVRDSSTSLPSNLPRQVKKYYVGLVGLLIRLVLVKPYVKASQSEMPRVDAVVHYYSFHIHKKP